MITVNSVKIIISLMIVTLMVCSSLGSFANSTTGEKSNNKNNPILKIRPISHTINFNNVKLRANNILKLEDPLSDIAISNETSGERHPSIVGNGKSTLAAYESDNGVQTHVYLKNSNDYGATWSDAYEISFGGAYDVSDLMEPSLNLKPGSNLVYGAVVSSYENSAAYGYFKVSDISGSISSVSVSALDWSNVSYNASSGEFYSFWDFSDANIVNYDNETTPWVMAFIGSTNYSDDQGDGPCTDSVMFSFNDLEEPEDFVSIAWFPNIEHCSNLDIANEYGNDMIYGVCEINNGSNQDLLFFKGNPALWTPDDAELLNQTITSDNNLLHPKIAVKGNDIYIVAGTDTNGIVMFHSSNGGSSWNKINVTEDILAPSDTPTYPDVVPDGEDLICTFIESENLSLSTSNDSGVTWTNPVKINDVNNSVVSGYKYYDIANKNQIAWTDIREGNQDVYYQLSYIPSVDLKVVSFSFSKENLLFPAKNLITIIVKNLGDGYAENVLINVSYECDDGNITTTKHTAIITRIGSYQTKTVVTNLFALKSPDMFQAFIDFAGITNVTVTVDPHHQKGDTNYNNNSLTKSVEYKDIFLRLWRLEPLFKLLKR